MKNKNLNYLPHSPNVSSSSTKFVIISLTNNNCGRSAWTNT